MGADSAAPSRSLVYRCALPARRGVENLFLGADRCQCAVVFLTVDGVGAISFGVAFEEFSFLELQRLVPSPEAFELARIGQSALRQGSRVRLPSFAAPLRKLVHDLGGETKPAWRLRGLPVRREDFRSRPE